MLSDICDYDELLTTQCNIAVV